MTASTKNTTSRGIQSPSLTNYKILQTRSIAEMRPEIDKRVEELRINAAKALMEYGADSATVLRDFVRQLLMWSIVAQIDLTQELKALKLLAMMENWMKDTTNTPDIETKSRIRALEERNKVG